LALGLGAPVKAERGGAGVDAAGGVGADAGVSLGGPATVDVQAQGGVQAGGTVDVPRGLELSRKAMGEDARRNQNAQRWEGATRSLDRAKARMSEEGLDHARPLEAESSAKAQSRIRGRVQ
jgi:hypothetical protein